MEQFIFIRGQKNNVEGVWCKCKWCGKEYGHNVTRLTQHFMSKFAPRQRGNMELPAFRREGSNTFDKDREKARREHVGRYQALPFLLCLLVPRVSRRIPEGPAHQGLRACIPTIEVRNTCF
ncbi:hypothetical protein R1flu_000133 [Riccia fluitans]|uniref:BED-type domain-containing protein n=1 Tax=Riccia fluitans TaxID=41844 RepID=A0ABD1XZK5_9MARC